MKRKAGRVPQQTADAPQAFIRKYSDAQEVVSEPATEFPVDTDAEAGLGDGQDSMGKMVIEPGRERNSGSAFGSYPHITVHGARAEARKRETGTHAKYKFRAAALNKGRVQRRSENWVTKCTERERSAWPDARSQVRGRRIVSFDPSATR